MAGVPPEENSSGKENPLPIDEIYIFQLSCAPINRIKDLTYIPVTVSPDSKDTIMYFIRSHFDIPFVQTNSGVWVSTLHADVGTIKRCVNRIQNNDPSLTRDVYIKILSLVLHQIEQQLKKPKNNKIVNETPTTLSQYAYDYYTQLHARITNALEKGIIGPNLYNKFLRSWHSPNKDIRARAVKAAASFEPLPPRVTASLTSLTSPSSIASAEVPAPPPSLTSLPSVPPTVSTSLAGALAVVPASPTSSVTSVNTSTSASFTTVPVLPLPNSTSGQVEREWTARRINVSRPSILVKSTSQKPSRSIRWSNTDPSIGSDPRIKSTLATAYQNKEKYKSVSAIVELYKLLNSEAKQLNVSKIIETSGKIQLEKEKAFADVQPIIKTAKEDQEKYGTGPLMAELYHKLDVAIAEKHIDSIKTIARTIAAKKEELIYGGLLQAAMADRDTYYKNPGLRSLYNTLDGIIMLGDYAKPYIERTAQSIVNAKKTCNTKEKTCAIAGGTRRRHIHTKHSRKSKTTRRRRI